MCTYLFFKKDYYFSNLVLAEVVLRKYLSDFRAKIRKTFTFYRYYQLIKSSIQIFIYLFHLSIYLNILLLVAGVS